MMKEEFLDSYDGYDLGFPMDPMEPPSLYRRLGDDHSDDDARYRTTQAGALIRRLGLVDPPEVPPQIGAGRLG